MVTRRSFFASVAALAGVAIAPKAGAPKLAPAGKPLPMNALLSSDTFNTMMKRINELVERENTRNGHLSSRP
jgi:hypothetical protein